jgi:hypothetical protein
MVTITIYIEGNTNEDPIIATIDNSSLFRENFHKLFVQHLSETEFNLIIQPIGSVSQTRKYLQKIQDDMSKSIILIDLDGPKNTRQNKLQSYSPLDTSRLFFMIQEMESWILSQTDKIDNYANDQGYTRRRINAKIENDSLIKGLHPEDIPDPSARLNTLFRKYLLYNKIKKDKNQNMKPKNYVKAKDGPRLIGYLDLTVLITTFQEVESMIKYLLSKSQP